MSDWFRAYGFADILDDLYIGAYPLDDDDVRMLQAHGVQRVLNLVEDGEYRRGQREQVLTALHAAEIEERRLTLTDFGQLPPEELETAVREVASWLQAGVRTYVHCRAGWQRSAAVAAGVVAVLGDIDIDQALDYVRLRKPSADPLPHQRDDLRRWWVQRSRRQRNSGAR